jgi:REP element-mobilizing transposase RayT
LRAAFRRVWASHPFTIEAGVILPDHLHMIWTFPEGIGKADTAFGSVFEVLELSPGLFEP